MMSPVNSPSFRPKYVAFLDMLGFTALVRSAPGDDGKLKEIIEAISRLRNTAASNPRLGMHTTSFSDCIVISADRTQAGLLEMLQSIKTIAENLLVVGMFLRGGLAVGELCHDLQYMFGPGMIEAYDLERSARIPAVLVSAEVYKDILAAGLEVFIAKESAPSGHHHVHYLVQFEFYENIPEPGLLILDGPALLVRHYIAAGLVSGDASIREKAEWMEGYWNATVATKGCLGSVDREHDKELPKGAHPFRSVRAIIAGPH